MRGYWNRFGSIAASVLLAVLLTVTGVTLFFTLREQAAYESEDASAIRELVALREAEFDLINVQRQSRDDMLDGHDDFSAAKYNAYKSREAAASTARGRESSGLMKDFIAAASAQNYFWAQATARKTLTPDARLEGERLTEEALFASHRVADTERRVRESAVSGLRATGARLGWLYAVLFALIFSLFVVVAYLLGEEANEKLQSKALRNQKILTEELNHRVKNLISICQSIALQTNKSTLATETSPEVIRALKDHFKKFEKRMLALSAAHRLLMTTDWHSVSLGELLDETLRPLVDMHRIDCSGPKLMLGANTAITMNLLFHELATNSIKYGSFSNESGMLTLKWRQVSKNIEFLWEERNGPPVVAPLTRGFGSKLVETAAIREVGGTAVLEFDPSGVVCKMVIPLSDKVWLDENSAR